jgi:hypothetical protein
MKNLNFFKKILATGCLILVVGFNLFAQAPSGFTTQAYGVENLVLKWTLDPTVDSYQVEQSPDSSTFTILGETGLNRYIVTGLDEATTYYFRLTAITGGSPVGEVGLKTETVAKELLVHLPLDELVDGDKIKNVLTDSVDVLSNGQVSLVDAETSGIGVPAVSFLGDGPVPIATWFRLWNTVQGWEQSLTGRSMSLWFKNESPDKNAVLLTFGKRAGGTIVIKENQLFGLTGMRHGDANKWWADSTGVDFSSTDWTHVTYVFDNPITKLYVNGVLVDESDGIGKMDGFAGDTALYWPSPWEMNKPTDGNGKSAELGCLFEPSAPMVAYLKDTWDAGVHAGYSFNGMMSDVKLFNYPLSDEEIAGMIAAAPANLVLQAVGQNDLVFVWDEGDADAYQVSTSTDSTTWTVVDTVTGRSFVAKDLEPDTKYYVKVAAMKGDAVGDAAGIGASTITKQMLVDMPLDELVDGDKIKNVVTDSLDVKSNGQMSVVDAATSGLGVAATKFVGDGPVPIATWARLWNTTQGMNEAFTQKTISLWFKNESPDKNAVLLSFGKRAGMTLALKDGKMHALTKMRTQWSGSGSGATWWVDSTGVEFNSGEWTHVSYVFDNPVTKLYINGVLADVSDGKGYWDSSKETDLPLPWPTQMGMNEPSNGNGQSAEIGCLFEPCAAMVYYLGDTWDAGAHTGYSFNGMMAEVKMYNYAVSDDDLKAMYDEKAIDLNVKVASKSPDRIALTWDAIEGATGYVISQDGAEIATIDATKPQYVAEGLTPETEYSFAVVPQGVDKLAATNMAAGITLTPAMPVHFPLDSFEDDSIVNVVDGTKDAKMNGIIAAVAMEEAEGFDAGALKFTSSELPPVVSDIRLYNTLYDYATQPHLERTVNFWMKMQDDVVAVPVSIGKRRGFNIVVEDGKIHALTGQREINNNNQWADSTGADYTPGGWSMITYQFDYPVTRLYVDGVMVDESDGLGYFAKTDDREHPTPIDGLWGINDPTSTTGASAEIGAQEDAHYPMVYYWQQPGWDPGTGPYVPYGLNGMLADMKMYNYALSTAEIEALFAEHETDVSARSLKAGNLRVYPNPVSDVLYLGDVTSGKVEIFDHSGKMVIHSDLENSNSISVSSLSNGIYIVKISDNERVLTTKISVVR